MQVRFGGHRPIGVGTIFRLGEQKLAINNKKNQIQNIAFCNMHFSIKAGAFSRNFAARVTSQSVKLLFTISYGKMRSRRCYLPPSIKICWGADDAPVSALWVWVILKTKPKPCTNATNIFTLNSQNVSCKFSPCTIQVYTGGMQSDCPRCVCLKVVYCLRQEKLYYRYTVLRTHHRQ